MSYTGRCWHKGTHESNIRTNTLLSSSVSLLSSQIFPPWRPVITTHSPHRHIGRPRLFLNTTLPHISSQRAPHGLLLSFNIQSPTCQLFSVHTARRWSHTVLISPCVGRESETVWLVWPGRVCFGVWDNVLRQKFRIKGIFRSKFKPWFNTPWNFVRLPLHRSS